MVGVEVWDVERDAWCFDHAYPVIAHPPCRGWGRLHHLANPRPDEKSLGEATVAIVQTNSGVLEHPAFSTMFAALGLPRPGDGPDKFGGYTISVNQWWWGHRAEKATWLYIVGCPQGDLPPLPPVPGGRPSHVIGSCIRKGEAGWRPEVTKREREATPPRFAEWLVEIARCCTRGVSLYV